MFKACLKFVLLWEGGFVDNPKDPGGVTNFGIALKYHPELTRDDILNMTEESAGVIYKQQYWDGVIPEWCPPGAALLLFDASVNQGPGYARKCLQKAAGAKVDGILGNGTKAKVMAMRPKRLVLEIAVYRAIRYATRPTFKTFGRGWFRRLLSCFALASSMSDA